MEKSSHPTTFEEIQIIVLDVIDELVEFCFLLGSAATARFNPDSDVDIAVYWKAGDIDFETKLKILGELEDRLQRPVDFISLNNIDVIYGMQVVSTGRVLITNNPGLLLSWKTHQLSRYPDFKISRAIIEKKILTRKRYV